MQQIRNSEALMVQAVQGGTTSVSQQLDIKPSQLQLTSGKGLTPHRLSDALLSQQSGRVHVSSGVTDSLIGQSQDSYLPQGAVHVSDAMIGQDRLMSTSMSDALLGRQMSFTEGVMGTSGEHTLIQGIQLHAGSMSDGVHQNVIVHAMTPLQGHQQGKSHGLNLANPTTFVTSDGQRVTVQAVNVHGQGPSQELSLVDEEDQKYTLPGDDTRMVNITHLEQNPSMGHHSNSLDGDEDEDDDDDNEDVDTQNLLPIAEMERQQEGTDRQHICTICLKGFKRAAHLKEHMHTHGPGPVPKKPKATPHKCAVCDKAFQKPSQVERHMRIHTGERPYRCNICGKAFNQKNALQVHLRKHSGEKPHVCPYCSSSFVQSGNLKTHIKRAHHTDMVSSMNISRASVESAQGGQEVRGHVLSSDQEVRGHVLSSELEEAHAGISGGEVNVGSEVGMEEMDLGEDVDMFVQI
ncbi:unnamed protein product [Lymnaea stagnalis]|uniref:C2H2-type domain-containing protein n=1 Tax=Lymnaea stagnalis TaxID=6523 RepID=A0AAV2I175_LYMST